MDAARKIVRFGSRPNVAASWLVVACLFLANQAHGDVRQSFGPTFLTDRIETRGGARYTFQSPGVGLLWNFGRDWGFAGSVNFSLPVEAAQNGSSVQLSNAYAFAFALDVATGIDRWFPVTQQLEFAFGPRIHALYTTLQGQPAYRTFQSAVIGAGLACQLVYTTDRTLLGAPVLVGTFLQSAADVVDVLHGDRFDYGLSLLGGFTAGVRW